MEATKDINDQEIALKLLESKEDKINDRNIPPSILETPPLLFSKRLTVTIMLFLGFVNFQVLRNNMNIAVVEMISNKFITRGNTTILQPAEFNWDSPTVGLVISVISYGGLLSFLNGFVINKLGPSTSCAVSMLLSGVTTLLHPPFLRQSFYAFLMLRLLTGILEAVFYASTAEIQSRWFPVKERSTLIAFSFNGTNAGVAMVYPLCGYLAHEWGWSMVFYVTGIKSVIIAVIFLILVKNHPNQDKTISKAELAYIQGDNKNTSLAQENNGDRRKTKVFDVFKSILTSKPIWALYTLSLTYMWIATVITACLPLYIKDLTGKESDEIGYISSIPNAVYIFMFPIAGALMDFWKNHSSITTTRIHKTMLSVAFISAVVFFIAVTFVSDLTTSLTFFVLIQICTVFVPLILPIITINLAPNHISHVASINTNFFCFGAIIAQTVTGFLTTNHSLQEWNRCFLLSAAVAVFGNVIIVIFGSSDAQKWSLSSSDEQTRSSSDEHLRSKDIH